MVIKVRGPLEQEYPLMRRGQVVYTYLHLAANKELTEGMLRSGCKGVAYGTLADSGVAVPSTCMRASAHSGAWRTRSGWNTPMWQR